MVTVSRILVVGAGIAGLATAVALRCRGFTPEIVEARAAPPAEGAAITLHGNGVRALRALGVGPALDAAGAVVPCSAGPTSPRCGTASHPASGSPGTC